MMIADLPLAELVATSTAIHAICFDATEHVTWANAAFTRVLGRPLDGLRLADVFAPVSAEAIRHAPADEALVVQLDQPGVACATLRAHVKRLPDGFSLAGEPIAEDHEALETELLRLNADLAAHARERARLYRELRDAHWHIRKTSAVLPMCMTCKAVKPGDNWQDASQFLATAGEFISHGYCIECSAALLADLDE